MSQQFSKGQKGKLADMGLNGPFSVTVDVSGPGLSMDLACFGLDADSQLSDDRYMVFFNQTSSPGGAVSMTSSGGRSVFQLDLARLPDSIHKLVFTAAIDQQGVMKGLAPGSIALGNAASFSFSGMDFQEEKAVILGEIYRRDGAWRFGAVGQGFNGGLSALLKHFGGSEVQAAPVPVAPVPAPEPGRVSLSKITLDKRGDKVSLAKRASDGFGRIRVNLNWNQSGGAPDVATAKPGFLARVFGKEGTKPAGVDLDLGCLFELANGQCGGVQALGDAFGNFDRPPFINLDSDDRTGNVSGGENLFINGAHFDQIRRVLVFAFIYDGVANWAATDGVVSLEMPDQAPIEVRLDNGGEQSMCAIALIENRGGELQVTKLAEYFNAVGNATAHEMLDRRFGFNLRWVAGSKD